MSLTREDVLRELELLPVWQLRAAEVVNVSQKITADKAIEITEQPLALPVAETSHYVLVSEDKNWAFVMPEALTGTADALFNNILLALQINKTHTETLTSLANVKVIVVMGELTAQRLLNSSESLEQLRGKVHVDASIPLVVTYHPNDLLQHLVFKPKMWDDLCFAKSLEST